MSKLDTYFAVDGSFGVAEGLVVVDTTEWTPDMWECIEDEWEHNRPVLAKHFASEYHLYQDEMCNSCGLKPYQLGVVTP
jgi:hypothetical protein